MAINEHDVIRDSIQQRINLYHKAENIGEFVWDYLGWSQEDWNDYIFKDIIPAGELIGTPTEVKQELPFQIQRYFTQPDMHPFSDITWETRQALITKADGSIAFQQDAVEFPSFWSQNATNIVASKYFRGQLHTQQREFSVKQMINRVVDTITDWGWHDGYFDNTHATIFNHELKYILVHQLACFNSPVWFNTNVPGRAQQSSACFILDVEDTMESILNWYTEEGKIFKGGSGAGINVSKIRSKREQMSGGGKPSGPLSFMKAADASAGVIKSGGVVRRAAKMVVMDIDHPDIQDFIWCKALEERKARALIAIGYDDGIDGEAYSTVAFQNANHSVSVTDDFLCKVENYEVFCTKNRTNYEGQEHKAEDLFHEIAQAAYECGDPGLFFYDTINAWHTTPSRGSIVCPNPCGEFLRPPNEACNLSSLNLLTFLNDDNTFDIEGFTHTVNVMITAMEILVSRSEYPTEAITKNSEDYRTLGLGYANLGALLMAKGLPYDSDEGRDYAASITALMTGQAYKRSAELAAIKGPFHGYAANSDAMMRVMVQHRHALKTLSDDPVWDASTYLWRDVADMGREYGYRNAQVTLLAPTGTISFMMDCTTTGVEPDVALVNYKKLVGGGTIKHVNDIVPRALKTLGYLQESQLTNLIAFGQSIETVGIAEAHLPVFDCAFPSQPEGRSIAWEGHVKMVAALQPFLSGSISKTINMPNASTVEDIKRAYMMAWKLGCKSIAVYRDGCKQTQVLTTQNTETSTTFTMTLPQEFDDVEKVNIKIHAPIAEKPSITINDNGTTHPHFIENTLSSLNNLHGLELASFVDTPQSDQHMPPQRKRLPDERQAITHKFAVGGCEGYLTVGLHANGQPGEIFLKMAKEGSTLSGFADAFACMVSLGLQYGIPLDALVHKFTHSRFEPSGWTGNPDIRYASSIIDYVFKYLNTKFGTNQDTPSQDASHTPIVENILSQEMEYIDPVAMMKAMDTRDEQHGIRVFASHNVCPECGSLLFVNGACQVCKSCGFNTGCSG